jgi:uncharacterized membrane protein
MGFDIRLPIGLLFLLVGLLLAAFGIYSGSSEATGSRGLNVNLWWGAVMLVFGLIMLALARRHAHNRANAKP